MKRSDLSKDGEFDGWQAIDATPQQISDGLFCAGPASVKAVKIGEILKPYDGKFVFAEVNADEVFWMKKENNRYEYLECKTDSLETLNF